MRLLTFFVILIGSAGYGLSQEVDSTHGDPSKLPGAIKASVRLDRKEVPQNRAVTFTVKVSWHGDLEKYEIDKLENPVLTNLEIMSNSSSNWVGEIAGVRQVVKSYEFVLAPKELGMAYVDGMIVDYIDMETGKKGHLLTNRLEVRVIDPIVELSLKPWLVAGSIFIAVLAIGGAVVGHLQRQKAKAEAARARAEEMIPIEEAYLQQLRNEVDLGTKDTGETFSSLSRILRSYLSERYDLSARGMSTREITTELQRVAAPKGLIEQTEEVLNSCDVARFSGGHVERSVVERAYTLVEEVLSNNRAVSSVFKKT